MGKARLILMVLCSLSFFISCKEVCDNQVAACQDSPVVNGGCQAYFETWFFNENTNDCAEFGYSGCSAKGFETLEECQECQCVN